MSVGNQSKFRVKFGKMAELQSSLANFYHYFFIRQVNVLNLPHDSAQIIQIITVIPVKMQENDLRKVPIKAYFKYNVTLLIKCDNIT